MNDYEIADISLFDWGLKEISIAKEGKGEKQFFLQKSKASIFVRF